jgi:predicted transcriptional regulator
MTMETVMAERLSPKAEEALRELASRPLGERPLMLEWDVESELQQRDFIEEAANGGWLISERGRAYVRDAHA